MSVSLVIKNLCSHDHESCIVVLFQDLPVHVSVEAIIVRNELIQSFFLPPPLDSFSQYNDYNGDNFTQSY